MAFGSRAVIDSAHDLVENLAELGPGRPATLPDAPRGFKGWTSSLQIGDTLLHAFAHTPVTVEFGDAPERAVMIPRFGSLTFSKKQDRFSVHGGRSLAFLAGAGRTVETTLDSHVVATLDTERLLRTARAILGMDEGSSVSMDLEQARAIATKQHGMDMEAVFSHLFGMMDELPADRVNLLGLDDVFYRSLAMLLSPEVAAASANPGAEKRARSSRREVDGVCDHVMAHLDQPISLSDLEQLSGLSARSLQLAFKKEFQCTPMQWVRQARLGLARSRLLAARPGDTVTSIALDSGFTQMGAFAAEYGTRFGERPSETLRRALSRS